MNYTSTKSKETVMDRMNDTKKVLFVVSVLIFIGAGLQACTDPAKVGSKFLERPPSQGFNKDSVFDSATRAKRFLWHAYRSLPYGPGEVSGAYNKRKVQRDMLASLTDINQSYIINGGANKTYYNPNGIPYSNNKTKYHYKNSGSWDGIREAYILINNIGQVPDMNQSTKDRLKAEARMIIALNYTQMIRHFGGLPWVDHAYIPNDKLGTPRATLQVTVDSTVAMIDKAIPDLPFALNQPSTEAGRFTAAGAMGLKVRLLLFAASPLFNATQPYMKGEAARKHMIWYGNYKQSRWQRAAGAAKELIDKIESSSDYHLVDTGNPREDFRHAYYDRSSPEVLISTRVRYKSPSPGNCKFGCTYYYGGVVNGGTGATTDNYVKMFPMADGTPIDDSNSGYDPSHPYENRDPRLYETVLTNGHDFHGRTAELYLGGRERKNKSSRGTESGYRMFKYVLDGASAYGTVVHYGYLRIPEIYLSYAEALDHVNGGPTAEAYKYVNKVRNRVGLNDLPAGMDEEEFRDAVLRERVLELGYEEIRWYDMIRYKLKDDFTKPLFGMNICKKGETQNIAQKCKDQGYGYHESSDYVYARFKLPARHWQSDFSPKWYLSQFPKDEVNKGYGLVQNPWE